MKYGEAIAEIARRTAFATEEQRRDVLEAIEKQHAPRGSAKQSGEPDKPSEPAK